MQVQRQHDLDRRIAVPPLANQGAYPFEKGVYRDANGSPLEVAVKRARSRD